MLGKLYLSEMRATRRFYWPLYVGVLLFSLILRLQGGLIVDSFSIAASLLMGLEMLLIFTLGIMSVVVTIMRFYKNLLGKEGYLMFTLPVNTHHNILSKLFSALTWGIISFVVVGLSFLIMSGGIVDLAILLEQIASGYQELISHLDFANPVYFTSLIFIWLLILLLSTIGGILFYYLSMAIGQLANTHKFLASIGAYLGLTVVLQIIGAILSSIFFTPNADWVYRFITRMDLTVIGAINTFTFFMFMIVVVQTAVFYIVTYHLLDKKLNLS